MLDVRNLTKSFGKMKALDNFSAFMEAGQSIALMGPNGSGKTTFIKCLLGLATPDEGEIIFEGQSVLGAWEYRRHIGYMPQIGRYPDHIKVGQIIDMVREIRQNEAENLDDDLLKAFHIDQFSHKAMRTLSGGMRQKVSACLAFLFNPKMLILDEPTAGLDPLSAEVLKEKVLAEKSRDKLVILTSHIFSDLEELTSDILYIIDGKIQFYEPIDVLKERTGEPKLNRALAHVMRGQNN
jgi:Cu-processing system ATP-binding protein